MKLRTIALSILAAFSILLTPISAFASTAVLYVSPASGTVPVGSIIAVQMRVNSGGDPINAVQGNITYNASQLAYQSIDAAGSAFSLTANVSATAGSLKVARATGGGEPAVMGDVLFTTVYFKALTTTGTSSVAVATDSHVVRSTDSVDIIYGAPAASGSKPSATGAPKATVYSSLAQAQAAVAGMATPTPAMKAPMAGSNTSPRPSSTPAAATEVLSWNSPVAISALALLVALVGVVTYVLYRRRHLAATAPAAAPSANAVPVAPHGSVDSKGVINSETVYPTAPADKD